MSRPSLSRQLVLEARRTLPDMAGGYSESWVVLGTLWADVVAGSGRDVAGEEVTISSVPYRITVRAAPFGSDARPRADQRLREGARIFRIVAVAERDADGRFLTCFAREEVPA
jgi:head-tail adaptor